MNYELYIRPLIMRPTSSWWRLANENYFSRRSERWILGAIVILF